VNTNSFLAFTYIFHVMYTYHVRRVNKPVLANSYYTGHGYISDYNLRSPDPVPICIQFSLDQAVGNQCWIILAL
jgi:hypothetical protein